MLTVFGSAHRVGLDWTPHHSSVLFPGLLFPEHLVPQSTVEVRSILTASTSVQNVSSMRVLTERRIPAGTWLHLPIWNFHHSTEVWGADAREFKPERHLSHYTDPATQRSDNGGGAKLGPSVLAFGMGAR